MTLRGIYLTHRIATVAGGILLCVPFVLAAPSNRTPGAVVPAAIAPIEAPFPMPQLQRPNFPDRTFAITAFGAVDDGQTKNTKALADAIAACHAAGGGKVLVPAGKWLTGAIHLKSNVNLHMLEGAEIHFSDDPADYLPAVFTRWAGFEVMNYSPLIYANGCENIAVTGPGKLFGHGLKWWPWSKRLDEGKVVFPGLEDQVRRGTPAQQRIYGSPDKGLRPQFISPVNCRNVLLEGFTIAEAGPFWTIHFVYCENVIARGLSIHTKQRPGEPKPPNTDGLNLDSSRNVLVEYCFFDVGDDAVCIKSGINEDGRRVGRPTENVVVRHVTAHWCHGGVVIGSEMSGGVRNVFAHDCLFEGSNVGIRLKSNAARGGVVENIHYRDITMRAIKTDAIHLITDYGAWGAAGQATYHPTFRNITIRNVTGEGARRAAIVQATAQKPVENLIIENVSLQAKAGMQFEWVRGLRLRNVTSAPESGEPVVFKNCEQVDALPSHQGGVTQPDKVLSAPGEKR
jgi:polygalacturonase